MRDPSLVAGLRPEHVALCLAARVVPTDQTRSLLASAVSGLGDLGPLIAEADHHGVIPLLERNVPTGALSDADAQALKRAARLAAARALRLTTVMFEALDALADAGIPAMVYKGPVLAAAMYGNVALRQFVDVDLLVPRRQALAARDRLEGLGYVSQVDVPRGYEMQYLANAAELPLRRPGTLDGVELQWRFAQRSFAFDLDVARTWERSVETRVAGREVRTLNDEDLLVVLCAHASRHRWRRLLWVTDVAELLRARPALDVGRAERLAREVGVHRMLLVGLRLADVLLDAAVPPTTSRSADRDERVSDLSRTIVQRFVFDEEPERSDHEHGTLDAIDLQLRERWTDRIALVSRKTFLPNAGDREAFDLPTGASFAYRIVRPIRLFFRYVVPSIGRRARGRRSRR